MHDILSPVRRSLVFRGGGGGGGGGGIGGVVEKIGSSIRKSRKGLFTKTTQPPQQRVSPVVQRDDDRSIRWWKGEMIGGGAFGCVYMGMNIDSGELLAIKQVSIAGGNASKDKTQAHIRDLEEEVRLLKNLSHPNIVRYLGTAKEDESFNILLEFVPGGSISSLLGKFGSFPEAVVRRYTKQILLGLEYLHRNGIIHRDIKGANILVDNMGHIKLADFGASKKVVELATMNAAKSMKGTPYWMAPEVILQTGHSFSADIWSVGCTIIEMTTGKPPWSQQYQEVAAIFHIGTTKSHPPIPDHLSPDAKDFLLKCLQKEPNLRPTALDLLQHPYVAMKNQDTLPASRAPFTEHPANKSLRSNISRSPGTGESGSSVMCSAAVYLGSQAQQRRQWVNESCDDMCRIDDKDDLILRTPEKFRPTSATGDIESFNPMSEPADDWQCRFEKNSSPSGHGLDGGERMGVEMDFTFPCGGQSAGEEDEEVTESKIRSFLDDKAMELKRLQSPLYEEFCNSFNVGLSPSPEGGEGSTPTSTHSFNHPKTTRFPTPVLLPSRTFSTAVDTTPLERTDGSSSTLVTSRSPRLSQWNLSPSFSERQRKWKEELDEELAKKREMMRQTCGVSRQKDKLWSPGR